jgi:anti-sigma28 factor (negative regulator of flagellin synthesis)
MTVTGRHSPRKVTSRAKATAVAGARTGDEIAQAARVEELRQMVAAGRYKVEPHKLALRILARALRHR